MAHIFSADGLITNRNELNKKEGALERADNVNIDDEGKIEPRRGFSEYGDPLVGTSDRASQLFNYKDTIIRHNGDTYTLEYDSPDGLGTFTLFDGVYNPISETILGNDVELKLKHIESNSNLYFTESSGIKKLSATSASDFNSNQGLITSAGGVKAVDAKVNAVTSPTGFLSGLSKCAYRIVWGINDNNDNLILGTPSERIILSNPSQDIKIKQESTITFNATLITDIAPAGAGAYGKYITFSSSNTDYFVWFNDTNANTNVEPVSQETVGRIAIEVDVTGLSSDSGFANATASAIAKDNLAGLDFTTSATGGVVTITVNDEDAGYVTDIAEEVNGIDNVTVATTIKGSVTVAPQVNGSLEFTIPQEILDLDYFTYAENYFYQIYRTQSISTNSSLDFNALDPGDEMNLVIESGITEAQYNAGIVSAEEDEVTESFRAGGTPLYTNSLSGEGILQANDKPPIAKDLTLFRDSVFYANTETPHRKQIEFLSVDDITSNSSTVVIGNSSNVREYTFIGETELTDIVTDTVANTDNGGYIEINSAENERKYYIWFRKSGTSAAIDPDISQKIGIEVDITADTTAEDVALSARDELENSFDFDVYRKIEIVDYSELVSIDGDTIEITSGLDQVTFVAQTGAVTAGDATFQAATSNTATATSLADQINAHNDLSVTAIVDGANVYISDNPIIVINEIETVDGTYTEDPLSVFVDETTDAQSAATGDVNLLQSLTNQADDRLYIGKSVKYDKVIVEMDTAGDGSYTLGAWEYWNGAWVSLTTIVDTTNDFKSTGTVVLEFDPPSDWATTTVDTSSSQYFIRATSGAGSRNTIPVASYIQVHSYEENHLSQHLDTISIRNIKNGNVDTVTKTNLNNAWSITNIVQGDGEDTASNHVLLSSLISVSQAVDETARSLVHVINSDLYSNVNAFYLSGPDDLPGIILLENRGSTTDQFFVATNDVNLITEFNPELPQFNAPTAIGTNDEFTMTSHGFSTGDKIFASGSFTSQIDGSSDITGNKITITAHPFQDNDTIIFGGNVNGTGITKGIVYYIINSAVNDFEISTARGGAALTLAATAETSRMSVTVGADIVSDTPIFGPNYYAIKVTDNTFKLATSKENAISGTAIDITTAATNTFGTFFHSEVESDNEKRKNRIYYSKVGQPESVPLINYIDVGPKDEAILRIIALRDNLMILKTDGIYLLSGPSAPNWSVRLIDSSTKIFAPETIAVLNNQIFALSSQGIVRISEVGAFVISRDIEDKILEIMNTDFNYPQYAFGVAYESERAYHLWLPTATTDTYGTQCYRYNTFTRAWTRWTKEAKCGFINPTDDKLYIGSGDRSYIDKERKTRTRKDFCDRDFVITFPTGFHSSTTLRPSTVAGMSIGDALVQTQYLTLNDINRLLTKLDLDTGVTNNYYNDFQVSSGDNLSAAMDLINARLVIDDTSGTVTAKSFSTNFVTLQTEYNTLIGELNDVNCTTVLKNYKQSTGSIEYETLIIGINKSAVELTVPDDVPFITGNVTVYTHFESEVTWAPQHFGDPNKMKHLRDASILFDQTNFYGAMLAFSSDISPEFDKIEFVVEGVGDLGNLGLGSTYLGGFGDEAAFRTYVPREKSRCRYIRTKFLHTNARNEFVIQGISYELRPISTRAWR